MKKIITTVVLLTTLSFTYAQTNTFPTTGNVGIGTTTPSEKLDVLGKGIFTTNIAADNVLKVQNTNSNGLSGFVAQDNIGNKYLTFGVQNSVGLSGTYGAPGEGVVRSSSSATGLVMSVTSGSFRVMTTSSGTERMRILDNGNVGIGTVAPYAKLDVVGEMRTNISSNEGGTLTLLNPNKTGTKAIRWSLYNMTGGYGDGLQFWSYAADGSSAGSRLTLSDTGNVGIGTSTPSAKLDVVGKSSFSDNMKVNAKIEAKEVKVTTTPTADFVFAENYALPKLEEVEKHIKEKKHLPEIASAKEMEKEGVNVGEFQIKLLQKIEELTLYTIEQNKRIKELESQNKEIAELKKKVQDLQTKK